MIKEKGKVPSIKANKLLEEFRDKLKEKHDIVSTAFDIESEGRKWTANKWAFFKSRRKKMNTP